MKILIEVQAYNRKPITEITLNQLSKHKDDCDLRIVNDYSSEYDNEWLKQFSDNVIIYEKKLNISKLKYRTFKSFLETDYTHLYMCDNDMYHDPNFVNVLKKYAKNNLPITLYRSSFIHSFGQGVHQYIKHYENVSLKSGLYGGASVFLNREHIEKIVELLPDTEEEFEQMCLNTAWDSQIQKMIDTKRFYLIPNKSYCEHYGWKGQNHTERNSDIALNPTKYLEDKSEEIWKILEKEYNFLEKDNQ
jgi:hypothetical protein